MAVVVTTTSTPALPAPASRLRHAAVRPERLAWLAAASLATLLVGGGLDRALVGGGGLVGALAGGGWLEWSGRLVGGLAWLLVLATAASVWAWRRDAPSLLVAATLAPIALLAQATLDTLLDAAAPAEVAHLALGMLALGLLVWTATCAGVPTRQVEHAFHHGGALGAQSLSTTSAASEARQREGAHVRPAWSTTSGPVSAELRFFRRVAEVTAGLLFLALVAGAAVRAAGASWACSGFPECNDLGVLPLGRGPLMDLHLYHRLLSMTAAALVAWLAVEAQRQRARTPTLARASLVLALVTALEAFLGVSAVTSGVPATTELLHLALAIAVWASAARVLALAAIGEVPTRVAFSQAEPRCLSTIEAYVQLTKPRVMSLLLVTTAAAMVVAARGLPPLGLVLATLVGGALMSGGAGAINHYVDRDIDPLMGRTAWRPIPSGRVSPRRALGFGLLLSGLATLVLLRFVNPLAAGLALVGLGGYVGVYSLWLKRSTPSNIVIGGAAGAVPPLVGWAAVNGDLGLTAWYLFAIVFFWTPPHFWALALLIKQHYARAHVPMLPVVRGEAETRRQILLYALLLVALTLVLSPLGLMGLPYFVAALLLGGWFVWNAIRLWRQATLAAARRLYVYSILYLFALFTAMAVDRVV